MYRSLHPSRPGSSVRSSRRGGTNVDADEGDEVEHPPGEKWEDDWESQPGISVTSRRSGVDSLERMTLAPTSAWTTGTL